MRLENAYVMRVPLKDLFQNSVPVASTSKLELGDNAGIRDLAKVEAGVLVLSGRSDDERGDQQFTCGEQRTPTSPSPSVWFWSGKDGDEAKPLGHFPAWQPATVPKHFSCSKKPKRPTAR